MKLWLHVAYAVPLLCQAIPQHNTRYCTEAGVLYECQQGATPKKKLWVNRLQNMSAVLWDVENRFPNCSDGCWTVEEFNICKQRGLANAIEHKKGSYVEGNTGYC
eukprot:Lankesteria_metandrocarpae@DN5157_c0_g3_i1.p1